MKRYILALLLLPSVAMAHAGDPIEDSCPICYCTLEQRDENWRQVHDTYWECYERVRFQMREYTLCAGERRAHERDLKKPITQPNLAIVDYFPGLHPVESHPNDVLFATFELDACLNTEASFLGESLKCSADLDALRAEASRRIKLRKR